MAKLTFLHLYPETLKFNGERGNLLALKVRAEQYGHTVEILTCELEEPVPNQPMSLIFLGSGTLSALRAAHRDLDLKRSKVLELVSAGSKVLAVGAGFDLISNSIELTNGTLLSGLGLTKTNHRITGDHLVGEVAGENEISGFINSDRLIQREDHSTAVTTVTHSDEPKLIGYVDGYRDGVVMASNVQGPLLPMNPGLADELIGWMTGTTPTGLPELDGLAAGARAAISVRVGN